MYDSQYASRVERNGQPIATNPLKLHFDVPLFPTTSAAADADTASAAPSDRCDVCCPLQHSIARVFVASSALTAALSAAAAAAAGFAGAAGSVHGTAKIRPTAAPFGKPGGPRIGLGLID